MIEKGGHKNSKNENIYVHLEISSERTLDLENIKSLLQNGFVLCWVETLILFENEFLWDLGRRVKGVLVKAE